MASIKVIIGEHERGLLYQDGRLTKWLEPGRHSFWSWSAEYRVERLDVEHGYSELTPELERIIPQGAGIALDVGQQQLAVITRDNRPVHCLEAGRYVLWQLRAEMRATTYRCDELHARFPESHAEVIPTKYWTEYQIGDQERGLLYRDGRLVQWLEPGSHRVWSRYNLHELRTIDLSNGFHAWQPELEAILPDNVAERLEVGRDQIALIDKDGRPTSCLLPGRYLLWQQRSKMEARLVDTRPLRMDIDHGYWPLTPATIMQQVTVLPHQRAVLYIDGAVESVLESGRYGFSRVDRQLSVAMVDMRERELQITGQEVITADKVTLRVNLIVKYRVTDALRSVESCEDLQSSLYSEVQMSARRYIGGTEIDELLESRNEAADAMLHQIAERARSWGVELLRVDIKDLILPGEMKTLLNQVIEAQKRAAANVITRREETAATRSLANTAKMMENNPTLLRLREMEVMSEMVSNIDQINVFAGADDLMSRMRMLSSSQDES